MTGFARKAVPLLAAAFLAAAVCAQENRPGQPAAGKAAAEPAKQEVKKTEPMTNDKNAIKLNQPAGLYAVFETAKGRIVCRLFDDKAPKTVANFVGLAEGTKEWTHPATGKKTKSKFYDGLKFMRVIPGFMIQGGDPLNTTAGGPGYKFEDEFHASLSFNKPGLLAMANAGPNTNGSQFFITDTPRGRFDRLPSHLTDHHTIFGEVVEGMSIVSAIADVPTDGGIAFDPVAIDKLVIVRVPGKAGK